jgi:hypothetical protein
MIDRVPGAVGPRMLLSATVAEPSPVEAINHVPKMMYRAFTLLALQPHHARHRSTWLERRTHL